jgi:hypothetical protein
MREKLNENPKTQAAVIAVLMIGALFLLLTSMHGGGSEEEGGEAAASTPAAGAAIAAAETGPASSLPPLPPPGSGAGAAPPTPHPVVAAVNADRTVALLFVREGGIDDRLTMLATKRIEGMAGVSLFVVPAGRISDYVTIAQGVKLNRLPALVVLSPRHLSGGNPKASVLYGFLSPESVVQAIIDAGYKGPTLTYHP